MYTSVGDDFNIILLYLEKVVASFQKNVSFENRLH